MISSLHIISVDFPNILIFFYSFLLAQVKELHTKLNVKRENFGLKNVHMHIIKAKAGTDGVVLLNLIWIE